MGGTPSTSSVTLDTLAGSTSPASLSGSGRLDLSNNVTGQILSDQEGFPISMTSQFSVEIDLSIRQQYYVLAGVVGHVTDYENIQCNTASDDFTFTAGNDSVINL